MEKHLFHTKHDFTPELGWSAFQILEQETEPVTISDLEDVARTVASPMASRSDLGKILGGLQDVGLIERHLERVSLSLAGRVLASSLGRYEDGFRKAVHCLYAWRWLWSDARNVATPSWSYREACRQILAAGPAGLRPDDLVLRVVDAADQFHADKVSFSRASVSGIVMWLEAQQPPLIRRDDGRLVASSCPMPTPGAWRIHLAALHYGCNGDSSLTEEKAALLGEALLRPVGDVLSAVRAFCADSGEFVLSAGSSARLSFLRSEDPFVQWLGTGER